MIKDTPCLPLDMVIWWNVWCMIFHQKNQYSNSPFNCCHSCMNYRIHVHRDHENKIWEIALHIFIYRTTKCQLAILMIQWNRIKQKTIKFQITYFLDIDLSIKVYLIRYEIINIYFIGFTLVQTISLKTKFYAWLFSSQKLL